MVSYKSTVDRVYKRYAAEESENVQYLHHPSGVTVVTLRNPPTSEVVSIDFGSTKKHGESRQDRAVVGKGKKGAIPVQKESKLCTIKCKDGSEIVVRAGVKGFLTELNERLKNFPDLVRTSPENQGYIAVLTYGAGKRDVEGFGEELAQKRVELTV